MVAFISWYFISKGFTFTFPSLKVIAAFKSFKFSLFTSINLMFEPNAVSKVEFLAFIVVESNCPSKSPESVFKSGVSSVASKLPFNLIVEFNFPLMIPAIGAIFFSISNWVNDCAIST
ncbi:hypothetical protein D3C80_1385480 [compost metagenome]